ncbi:hypothetical protein VTO73DRAFT_8495 [Trametes versicolor]
MDWEYTVERTKEFSPQLSLESADYTLAHRAEFKKANGEDIEVRVESDCEDFVPGSGTDVPESENADGHYRDFAPGEGRRRPRHLSKRLSRKRSKRYGEKELWF